MTSNMKLTISAALQQEEILQKDPSVQHLEKNYLRAKMKATLRRKEKGKGKDNNAERISQMLILIPKNDEKQEASQKRPYQHSIKVCIRCGGHH
jgi:hypothetical protein